MEVIDPGHEYLLQNYDAFDGAEFNTLQNLTFVKRFDPPEKYPGNDSAYPGTLMQEVIKALIERLVYVNNQTPCAETESVLGMMRTSLLLLEIRANRIHNRFLDLMHLDHLEEYETCKICGHVQCPGDCR